MSTLQFDKENANAKRALKIQVKNDNTRRIQCNVIVPFSHVMHKHPAILEMTLALTFRPTDSHCIHIDASTSDQTRDGDDGV
jgi:hypothetical protein